jgi:hypothetical protein
MDDQDGGPRTSLGELARLFLRLAWGYVRYGELPNVEPLLAGIKPCGAGCPSS